MGYIIICLTFFSVVGFVFAGIPLVSKRFIETSRTRSRKLTKQMEQALLGEDFKKKMKQIYILAPLGLGLAGFFFFPPEIRILGLIVGVVVGFILPNIYVRGLIQKNRSKFNDQLVDALMIMSSSFRGGLSLVQAMEAVVEEMPDPVRTEFAMALSENKMGVSLEEALNHLYQRMPSPSLQQMITAILLARETGGNLPAIFARIVSSIREKRKVQQNLETLTIQGKIQGIVMTFLPIGFAFVIYSSNPRFLQNMMNSDLGRFLLIYAVISECIGAFMIWKISTFKDV